MPKMAGSRWLPIAALSVILCGGVHTFKPFTFDQRQISHGDITETAILRKTAEVCRDLAQKEGRPFSLTIDNRLSASAVQAACSPDSDPSLLSSIKFKAAIMEVYVNNWSVDLSLHFFDAEYHFDNEKFVEGRNLITQGRSIVKNSVKEESFLSARVTLGKICHTLQDFYSHSNWIELKNQVPFSTLIKPDVNFINLADKNTATCTDCIGGNCENNILPEILSAKTLTSGYFDVFSGKKPPGKCSHGGFFDRTSKQKPLGGISKDTTDSDHGNRHVDAANVAINATMELLEDIRGAIGDINFLRLMGITHSSVLAFVIDTTGSMFDDIEEAKRVAFSIIDSKQASAYILVPFNDPEFGPLTRTTDADLFKQRITALGASGGGDEPEMCLSGLQLALTGAPPSSEIFVFTDASAKDIYLKSTVLSLMESTKSVVTFMLTKVFGARRRRSNDNNQGQQQQFSSRVSSSASQEYQQLAQASGGLAIQASKANLPQATSIILDSTTSALVTLFQAVRDPGKDEELIFMVDPSIRNMTAYITGNSVTYSIQNPLGVLQSSAEPNGPLGSIQAVGNLNRIQLNQQEGLWKIHISSTQPYQLKVTGRSTIDFIFTFFNILMDPLKGMELNEGRPQVGKNATLFLTVTSNTPVSVTEVLLVEASGAGQTNGTLQDLGLGSYLMTVDTMPEGVFNVRVTGMLASSSRSSGTLFQRQSNIQIKASNLIVSVQGTSNLEPGVPITIPFTVRSPGSSPLYLISVRDDKNFLQTFTGTLKLVNGSAEGSVNLIAPGDTPSGTDVTVTITAHSSDNSDSNYAVVRLSVISKVTDINPPVCQGNMMGNCSGTCSLSSWELSANVTDVNGTGVTSVSARGGNGTLNSTTFVGEGGINVTQVFYSASCCAPDLELVVVDAVGNVGRCIYSVRAPSTGAAPSTGSAPSTSVLPTVPVTPSKGAASMAPHLSVWASLLIILKAFIVM
ncbi:von Willebrand factor A domain-containing protein 7 [Brienomyrus brachyistius]|uniref:von Willebrand factor A domain-containing protein 7 n=1 Tax=Brienomyrus brachyistius TaxID=42636 RepID=UPI0020B3C4D8|nr:von Willebrand factor A domain-containing protein 7 [Brienomyrus brachyistius]